jgi:hypothetical protein
MCILCIVSGVVGYVIRWKQSPQITVSQQGEIIGKTNIGTPPRITASVADNCGHRPYIDWCSLMYEDYKLFLLALPEVYEVSSDKIKFRLHTQRYQLSYKYTEKARWSITPWAFARATFVPTLGIYYGGGCSVEYYGISGMVLVDNQPSLTASLGYRILLP